MKLVHLSDLHLGYRAYSKLTPEGLNIREKDVLDSFMATMKAIAKINPDLILLAGDVFHRPRPSNFSIYNSIRILLKFREYCTAPIVIISGNHEAVKTTESGSVLTIFEHVIPKVKVITDTISEVVFPDLNTSVTCIPYPALAEINSTVVKPDSSNQTNLLVIHGTYETCPEFAEYEKGELITGKKIYINEWDYVAFGHYHKYTELAPNCFYSGAIDRTTSNIWNEANNPKGFIEFDTETKIHKFHKIENLRKVYDIKRIDASNLTGEEVNNTINGLISGIKDFESSIVRITLENVDDAALKALDYTKIREYKRKALHFRLNAVKKSSTKNENPSESQLRAKSIEDYLEEELKTFELSNGLDKKKFEELAKQYMFDELNTVAVSEEEK